MRHDRSMIRHHRERVIANRVRFIRNVLQYDAPWRCAGTFSKRKPLDCSCPMCQSPTKATTKGKERQLIKSQLRVNGEV